MIRWQKIAWFNLAVIGICFLGCFALGMALQIQRLITPPSPFSLIIIPSLILLAVSRKIFRKKSDLVDFDERDKLIHEKSKRVGLFAFVLAVVAQILICFFAVGPTGTLQYPLVLLLMVLAAGAVWIGAESISTLIQYGKDSYEES